MSESESDEAVAGPSQAVERVEGGDDRGGGETGDAAVDEEEINWFTSPFYLGNFFTKLESSDAEIMSESESDEAVAGPSQGIPCSSAKSERVFSTGGFMVTKKRNSLGAERVENLIVLKENMRLVEEFRETDREMNAVGDSRNDAFEGVKVLVEKDHVTAPLSELFDDDQSENEIWEDSSDDEFEVVVEKATSTVT